MNTSTTKPLVLAIGRDFRQVVADRAEASSVYAEQRDQSGEGASSFPVGKLSDGARISYNGRVWLADVLVHEAVMPGNRPAPSAEYLETAARG